jgi:hypothetical protein
MTCFNFSFETFIIGLCLAGATAGSKRVEKALMNWEMSSRAFLDSFEIYTDSRHIVPKSVQIEKKKLRASWGRAQTCYNLYLDSL